MMSALTLCIVARFDTETGRHKTRDSSFPTAFQHASSDATRCASLHIFTLYLSDAYVFVEGLESIEIRTKLV